MIRVFISSTFTDMSCERRALLESAYPEVLAFCRSLGFVFEVVDLCWGIRSDLSGDHELCDLVLQEIQNCRRVSAGPAFAALLGNRYGHRSLPRCIPEKQFEALLSKLDKNPDGVSLLSRWFLKDDNAVPPAFVLQPITAHFPHYGDLRPESRPQHDDDVLAWRFAETQLLELLRSAAADAKAAGDITAQQKQAFDASVMQREVEEGLSGAASEPPPLLFVRELPRQRLRERPKRFAKYVNLAADGLLDAEAQELLAGLKERLHAAFPKTVNLHRVELSKGAVDPGRKEHAQYLDAVCQQFVSQLKDGVAAAASRRRGKVWGHVGEEEEEEADWVAEEVQQNAALSAALSRGLHGREALLGKLCCAMWESTNAAHRPLVLHGAAGVGKTALLCRLAQEMRGVLEAKAVVVIRLLAAPHPRRLDVERLLRGVCFQIRAACGLPPPPPAGSHLELLRRFRDVLAEASRRGNTVLVVLDALDRLSDRHHAHNLRWLPADVPPNVHLVVSMDTDSEAFASARLKLQTLDGFFEVERLSRHDGKQIAESHLRACRRTLTSEQSDGVLRRFEATGCPLHLRLMLSAAERWTSFSPLADSRLGANAQEMMSQLFLMLEEKHGTELVGGALGYLTLARDGLLEAELRDLMSLDDDVIGEVYRHSLPAPPSLIRLPPLLWARLRRDLRDQLEERWAGGVATIGFSHWRLHQAAAARYLAAERRGRRLKVLAEYFLGRWAGKLKPASLPGRSLLLTDRKVPPQPLWFAPGLANVRKLQELPLHLLQAGLWDELREEVIGSAEWLYCKSRVCGVSSVIQDLDQCSVYMDCSESDLIRDALVLIKPSLDFLGGHMDAPLFYSELLARLCSLAASFPAVIGRLCGGCEEQLLACPEPVLVPKSSFLQQPGGALQHTLTGLQGGVLCMDVGVEAGLLVAGADDGEVAVWSLGEQQLVHSLLGHTGAVLSVRVTDGSARCLSLAADGSLRRWSLTSGQQLLCIQEAAPPDSAPSAVHLHLSDQLLCVYTRTQVKMWRPDGSELLCSSGDEASGVQGVLGVQGVHQGVQGVQGVHQGVQGVHQGVQGVQGVHQGVQGVHQGVLGVLGDCVVTLVSPGLLRLSPPVRTQTVETPSATAVAAVTLLKRQKVLVVTEEGALLQISRSGKQSSSDFLLLPSLLLVSEDESVLVAASGRTLSLFSIDGDSVNSFLDLQHDDSVLSACVSSDRRLLVSGAADQLIRVWSVTTGTLLDSLCGSDAPVTSVRLYGGFVVSASTASACVHLWRLQYDERHKPPAHIPAGCAHVAVTKDADRVYYVQNQNQTEVISWNNLTGSVSDRLPLSAPVRCLEVAQQKRLLLCGLSSGTVLIYPLAQPQETLCIPPPPGLRSVLCLAVSPPERHAAVAYEDSVGLFEITTRDGVPAVEGPLRSLPLPPPLGPPTAAALLADRTLLFGTSSGAVRLHRFDGGGGAELQAQRSRVTCVVASNWGTHALVGSEDAVQRLWALNPAVLEHTMEYKGFFFEGVVCAAFSDSDQFVFTGSRDRTIKVWDVATGVLLCVQYVYSPPVRMVPFRNGFVALTRRGSVIRELLRCPDRLAPDHNPLRGLRAQCRVTSREGAARGGRRGSVSELQDFNPAQFNLSLMDTLGAKPSPACCVL